jgi:hypothetical protein
MTVLTKRLRCEAMFEQLRLYVALPSGLSLMTPYGDAVPRAARVDASRNAGMSLAAAVHGMRTCTNRGTERGGSYARC